MRETLHFIGDKKIKYSFDKERRTHVWEEVTIPEKNGIIAIFPSRHFSKESSGIELDRLILKENMNNLKTGDILHCTNNGIISRLIRWVTRSEWSHTALVLEMCGSTFIIEAQKNGVNLKTYDNWMREYGYTYKVHRNLFMTKDSVFINKALSKAGVTGYDLVSLLLRHPWKIITGSWRKQKKEDDKMYCSEYVAWCHNLHGWSQLTPDDVHEYCENDENWLIVDEG